jgi:hypothetical protein
MITTEMERLFDRFYGYAVFDDIGDIAGVEDSAPEDARDAYEEFMKIMREAAENGVKICP